MFQNNEDRYTKERDTGMLSPRENGNIKTSKVKYIQNLKN